MTFIFDANLSPRVCRALRELGFDVSHVREEFGERAQDVDWIPATGARDAILLTADERIRYRSLERRALEGAGITTIFLQPFYMRLGMVKQAAFLLTHWDELMSTVADMPTGTHFKLYHNGHLEPWPID